MCWERRDGEVKELGQGKLLLRHKEGGKSKKSTRGARDPVTHQGHEDDHADDDRRGGGRQEKGVGDDGDAGESVSHSSVAIQYRHFLPLESGVSTNNGRLLLCGLPCPSSWATYAWQL